MQVHGLMEDMYLFLPYVRLINCRFYLFRSSASSFSSQYLQIIKDLCSSSSYSFHFRHFSFNGIMKEAISSQNLTNPIGFSMKDIIWKRPLLSYTFNLFIGYFPWPFYLFHSPPAPHFKALKYVRSTLVHNIPEPKSFERDSDLWLKIPEKICHWTIFNPAY